METLETALVVVLAAGLVLLGFVAWVLRRRVDELERRESAGSASRDAGTVRAGELEARWDEVLGASNEGIVVLTHAGVPSYANKAARRLLGLEDRVLPPRLPNAPILAIARRVLSGEGSVTEVLEIRGDRRRTLELTATQIRDGEEVLLVLRDVSDEARTQTMRRQFVAHASHELKSPVAGIHALAEAIEQAAEDDPDNLRRFTGRLREEAGRLGSLVGDLLDLSRLEEPSVISSEAFSLTETIAAEVAQKRGEAIERGLVLSESLAPDVYVRGDERQIEALLSNLLDNAIRYTAPSGRVEVRLTAIEDTAQIDVTDDGPGIPLRAQGRVFERFFRVDEGRARADGGTGLGLAIVKHVAELHGGEVRLQSELGEGSTFTVILPRAHPLG